MSAVSRYGATTLTGQNGPSAQDAGVVDHGVDPAELVDLIGHRPRLVEVRQVADDA
jgi:hypothetical protein